VSELIQACNDAGRVQVLRHRDDPLSAAGNPGESYWAKQNSVKARTHPRWHTQSTPSNIHAHSHTHARSAQAAREIDADPAWTTSSWLLALKPPMPGAVTAPRRSTRGTSSTGLNKHVFAMWQVSTFIMYTAMLNTACCTGSHVDIVWNGTNSDPNQRCHRRHISKRYGARRICHKSADSPLQPVALRQTLYKQYQLHCPLAIYRSHTQKLWAFHNAIIRACAWWTGLFICVGAFTCTSTERYRREKETCGSNKDQTDSTTDQCHKDLNEPLTISTPRPSFQGAPAASAPSYVTSEINEDGQDVTEAEVHGVRVEICASPTTGKGCASGCCVSWVVVRGLTRWEESRIWRQGGVKYSR